MENELLTTERSLSTLVQYDWILDGKYGNNFITELAKYKVNKNNT
jgi:hypothetical protein